MIDIVEVLGEVNSVPSKNVATITRLEKGENEIMVKKIVKETNIKIVNTCIDVITNATKMNCC